MPEGGESDSKETEETVFFAKGMTGMELTIVDESDTGDDIPDIHARQYVECKSPPHGIDGRYLVLSKTKDYLNPSKKMQGLPLKMHGSPLTRRSTRKNMMGWQSG